ncbi:hypothetical protein Ahy_B05g076672 [Arachis hypogaea]|uniref:Uncharacterized protein n=1 Tax=Arachis hypogaea TaxID=3818 RepID=A0A444Z3U6_ARAHY|nr:hypothetical protein Ahy_B05g076672 [Arachis hypogaea]
MMQEVCEGHNHLMIWLRPDIKKELDVHLVLMRGLCRCRQMKYTGRSATFMKTKSMLSKSLEREVTLAETFKYTHTLKANKEKFVDERSTTHYEDYTQRLEAATQQSQPSGDDSGSDASVVDPDRVWRETASESYKNRAYGLGSFFTSGLHTSTLAASSASASATSTAHPEEVIDLREEEIYQQAQQSKQRYKKLLVCIEDTIAIRSELMEKLERLEHLRDQMAVYNEQICAGGSGAAGGTPTSAPSSLPQ